MWGMTMKRGRSRATRKIPAATIVAACIRAEIEAGPSIASGSCLDGKAWKANGKDMMKHLRNGHSR
ncbi:hypothetical protein Hdeb2414_s0014g00426991 [Helianthus debilis subsp. tardiflorus]